MAHFYSQLDAAPDLVDLSWHLPQVLIAHHGTTPEAIAALRWADVAAAKDRIALFNERTLRLRIATLAPTVREA